MFVETTSLFLNVLNVLAIFYPFYAGDLINLIGMSILYPVVTPVTRTIESINLTLEISEPEAPGSVVVPPSLVNR